MAEGLHVIPWSLEIAVKPSPVRRRSLKTTQTSPVLLKDALLRSTGASDVQCAVDLSYLGHPLLAGFLFPEPKVDRVLQI